MKWLFIIVALFNIGFFVYNSFFKENESKQQILANNSKHQIILLSELNKKDIKQLNNKVVNNPQSVIVKKVSVIDKKSVNIEEITQIESDIESNIKDIIIDQNTVQKLNLNVDIDFCFNLGPLAKKNMNDVKFLLEKKYQNNLSFSIGATSAITYYRIYIPPIKSKKKQKNILAKLDENDMKDHYVMSINGRKNAIALGVFKKRSAAENVAIKANKIGLSTTIEAITDDKNSLYKLQLLFHNKPNLMYYRELIEQKKIKSLKCNKKIDAL
jgi:hypothetical protein